MAEKKKTVSIVYEEAPSRPVIPVGGAYGGPSPDGTSVIAHLYNEFASVPTSDEVEVDTGGHADFSKTNPSKLYDVTRFVQATLVLSPEAAIRLGVWLTKHGTEATEHRQKNQPLSDSK